MSRELEEIQEWHNSPKRFLASRSTLVFDRAMTVFIKLGGVLVIAAVLGIFVFIFSQVLPLFKSASVKETRTVQLPELQYQFLGVDEWSTLAFVVEPNGKLLFVDLLSGKVVKEAELGLEAGTAITAVRYNAVAQQLVYGTADGKFVLIDLLFHRESVNGTEKVTCDTKVSPLYTIGAPGEKVVSIGFGDDGTEKLAVAILEGPTGRKVQTVLFKQSRSLLGGGKVTAAAPVDVTANVHGTPERLLVGRQANLVLVGTKEGEAVFLERQGATFQLIQTFKPFSEVSSTGIAMMEFLPGEVSVYFSNEEGVNRAFSLYVPPNGSRRLFGLTKEFGKLPTAAETYFPSLRNRSFLISSGHLVSLRYSTTATVRWEKQMEYRPKLSVLSGKYNRILVLDSQNKLHILNLSDPHPESSLQGLFGKVWYDGYSGPGYAWQSTGGSDDFEPKLSLVPLIFGTLKGTFYAMLFSLPIALLAAIYTSQYLDSRFRQVVKPMMEIMASLPSVVLGFLGALWLAPIIETRMPSLIAVVVLVPILAMFFGWFWAGLPIRYRILVKPGYEFLVFAPLLLLTAWFAWHIGPALEPVFFSVRDPGTGHVIADFRRWWTHATGLPFEQRNSLVVGIMMGFAVIPIIFTITEDALSNVPPTLRSASLALGASRWQTTMRVILPTASAGIFSAAMIGLGRAVGETMIVVMATGNTPIMNFNIFSGMRTLSANIAVELPEAPFQGTLYRTLFLGGMMLFLLTFLVNTVAEVMRQHLREKYKTV